ncbi:MAG: hypothetical protein JO002_15015 [Burkholderiaceae bacterium]|nr:hypothetical protein [Burkholderiaceae bacterium]
MNRGPLLEGGAESYLENDMASVEQTYIDVSQGDRRTVSWGAIFCGAVFASALYLIFTVLGAGLGFSLLSPWNYRDYAPGAMGAAAIIWIIVTQIVSSGGGGYLAGRLAPKVADLPIQELHFRDTAHGLAVWAIATLAVSAFLWMMAGTIISSGASALAAAGKGVESAYLGNMASLREDDAGEGQNGTTNVAAYALDSLFRTSAGSGGVQQGGQASTDVGAKKAEVTRIYANALWQGKMSDADAQYAANIVSQSTGLSQADATRRVSDTFSQVQGMIAKAQDSAKQALDSARKATAMAALWTFVTLLCGAIVSAVAGNYGGAWQVRFVRMSRVPG